MRKLRIITLWLLHHHQQQPMKMDLKLWILKTDWGFVSLLRSQLLRNKKQILLKSCSMSLNGVERKGR
jgi:hypothetical protein